MTGVALPGEHYPRKDSVGRDCKSFLEEEEEEEEEGLFKANAVNEEEEDACDAKQQCRLLLLSVLHFDRA